MQKAISNKIQLGKTLNALDVMMAFHQLMTREL